MPKILIIDDEEGIRESLKLILENHYQLIVCNDSEQALHVVQKTPDIALVLLDIKMPKVNGLEVLAQIKQERPELPVIMVTGYKSFETGQEAARLGAAGYIVKPFKTDEILQTVRDHVKS